MWPIPHHILRVLERPITDLRNPIWDWEWSVKAFLSHFALGDFLGLLVTLLIVFSARRLGAAQVSRWDYRRLQKEDKKKKPRFFTWIRRGVERVCLGGRHESLFLDPLSFAFRVAFFSGLIANVIDTDHVLMFYGGPDRLIHKPACVIAAVIVVYCLARMFRCKDEYSIRRYALWLCLALSIIVHVVEDYALGWF